MESETFENFQDLSQISVHHFDVDSISNTMFTGGNNLNKPKKDNIMEDEAKLFSDNEDEDIPNISHTRRTIEDVVKKLLSSDDQIEECSDATTENISQKVLSEIDVSSEESSTANMGSSKSLSLDASDDKLSGEPSRLSKTNQKTDQICCEFDFMEFHTAEDLHCSLKTSTVVNSPNKEMTGSPAVSLLMEKGSRWVQCDRPECQKWRRVDHLEDLSSVTDGKWLCCMNEDDRHNKCDDTQETIPSDSEDESVYSTHTPGSLVLGKMTGYPWWPAIIEDDPDFNSYFYLDKKKDKTLVSYHLTFLGKEVSRAWLPDIAITNFNGEESLKDLGTLSYRGKHFGREVAVALKEAKMAKDLSLKKRVRRYGFLRRYKGADKPQQMKEVSLRNTKESPPQAETHNVNKNVGAPRNKKETEKKVKPMGKLTARKFKENAKVVKKGKMWEKDNKCEENVIRKKKSFKISCKPIQKCDDSIPTSDADVSVKTENFHLVAGKDEFKGISEDNRDDGIQKEQQGTTNMSANLNEMKLDSNDVYTNKSDAPASTVTDILKEAITPSEEHAEHMIVKYTDKNLLERVIVNADTKKKSTPKTHVKQKSGSTKDTKTSNSKETMKKPSFLKKKAPKVSDNEKNGKPKKFKKVATTDLKKLHGSDSISEVLKDVEQLSSDMKVEIDQTGVERSEQDNELITDKGTDDGDDAPFSKTKKLSIPKNKKIKKSDETSAEKKLKKKNDTKTKAKKVFSMDKKESLENGCATKQTGDGLKITSQLSNAAELSPTNGSGGCTGNEVNKEDLKKLNENCDGLETVSSQSKLVKQEVINGSQLGDGVKNVPKLVKPTLPAATAEEIIKKEGTKKTLPKLKKSFRAPIKNLTAAKAHISKPKEIAAKRGISGIDDSSMQPPKKKAIIEDEEFAEFEFDSPPTSESKCSTTQINVGLPNSPEF